VDSGVLSLAREWSVAISEDVEDRISLYMRQLLEWNRRVNLTGASTEKELLHDHVPDSFALSRFVVGGSNVIDVGSGGGLPGVPFAILRPDCRITLLEPRAKRVAFLNAVVRVCGCKNARVVRGRLEECESSAFSVAVSRATFSPDEWLEKGRRLVGPRGRVVLLTTSAGIPEANGVRVVDSVDYRTANSSSRWAGCYCST